MSFLLSSLVFITESLLLLKIVFLSFTCETGFFLGPSSIGNRTSYCLWAYPPYPCEFAIAVMNNVLFVMGFKLLVGTATHLAISFPPMQTTSIVINLEFLILLYCLCCVGVHFQFTLDRFLRVAPNYLSFFQFLIRSQFSALSCGNEALSERWQHLNAYWITLQKMMLSRLQVNNGIWSGSISLKYSTLI